MTSAYVRCNDPHTIYDAGPRRTSDWHSAGLFFYTCDTYRRDIRRGKYCRYRHKAVGGYYAGRFSVVASDAHTPRIMTCHDRRDRERERCSGAVVPALGAQLL